MANNIYGDGGKVVSRPPPPDTVEQENPGNRDDAPFNFTRGRLIGRGSRFGRVYAAKKDNGEIVAVKQVAFLLEDAHTDLVEEQILSLEKEAAVMKSLRMPNIVQYLGTSRSEDTSRSEGTLNIFLEYVSGGSIASLIDTYGPLRESVVRVYTKQILRGLEYLHQRNIMHRDIKGANILVDNHGTVKLADFGSSKQIADLASMGSTMSAVGTPYWMAPEVIKQTGHGLPADIWSIACVVIEMASGKHPWSENTCPTLAAMFHIAKSEEPPEFPAHLSPEAKDFLLLCFNRVPRERPSATSLLQHPWMLNTVVPSDATVPPWLLALDLDRMALMSLE